MRQLIGDGDITKGQLHFLAEVADLPNVMIQVLPFGVGAHGAMMGSFEILGFPEPV